MASRNNQEKSLLNSKPSNKIRRICINWEDFGIENENEEGDGNYYCYFYTKSKFKPGDNFVLDKNHDPQVKKNDYEALYINYDKPENHKVRFCLVDKKMTNEEAKSATPETKKEVGWFEFDNGEIMQCNSEEQKWDRSGISFLCDELDSPKQNSFLMRFNNCSKINISGGKFKQIISADLGMDIDNIDEDKIKPLKVYVFAQFASGSNYRLLQKPYLLSDALKNNFETRNCCNNYMKDMLCLRFIITTENFKIGVGGESDEIEFAYKTNRSVFSLRKDEQNNIALSHLITKNKTNKWESVDAEITLKKQVNNSLEWQEYKYISKAKVGVVKSFFTIIKAKQFCLFCLRLVLVYFLVGFILRYRSFYLLLL